MIGVFPTANERLSLLTDRTFAEGVDVILTRFKKRWQLEIC